MNLPFGNKKKKKKKKMRSVILETLKGIDAIDKDKIPHQTQVHFSRVLFLLFWNMDHWNWEKLVAAMQFQLII